MKRINKIWGINISFMIGGSWMAVVMWVFICFGLFSSLAEGGRIDFYHPSIIVSRPELDWIRQKVQAGEEPWKSAYDEMIKYAEEWMSRTPDPPDEINVPAYYEDPEANGKASRQLGEAGRITNLFALAYQMTDKTAYAEKALSFLMAWANKMVKGDKGYDTSLRICNHVTQMVIAADLLWHYPGFSRKDKQQFQKWIRENMTEGIYEEFSYDYTNHGHWGMWAAMTIETILEREDEFLKAVERFKNLIRDRIEEDGLIKEKFPSPGYSGRPERSLLYMIYAIEPTVRAAELARHYDIDLYNYKASNGRHLKLAVDCGALYALHPGDWPYRPEEQYTWWGLPRSFWEMAYREWRDADYLEIIKHDNGRPNFWRWTGKREFLACPTLTHGVPYGYSGYLPPVRDKKGP